MNIDDLISMKRSLLIKVADHSDLRNRLNDTFDRLISKRQSYKPWPIATICVGILLGLFINGLNIQWLMFLLLVLLIFAAFAEVHGSGLRADAELRRQLSETLCGVTQQWVEGSISPAFSSTLSTFQLRSLKTARWEINAHISLSDGFCSPFRFGTFRSSFRTPIATPSGERVPICPGITIDISKLNVVIECDFRKERDQMSQEDLLKLFELVIGAVPSLSPQLIGVKQFSSTKSFDLNYKYLETGDVQREWHRLRQRKRDEFAISGEKSGSKMSEGTIQHSGLQRPGDVRLTATPRTPTLETKSTKSEHSVTESSPVESTAITDAVVAPGEKKHKAAEAKVHPPGATLKKRANAAAPEPSLKGTLSKLRATSPTTVLRIRRKVDSLISDIVAKRALTERIAMEAVMVYETSRGRKPENVSALNVGYDILSEAGEKKYRRIEVKGLSGEGDVIITQNEVDSSQQTTKRDKYYVYVVDNCLSGKPKRLYILEGINKNILRPQVAEYSISAEQVSEKAGVYTL